MYIITYVIFGTLLTVPKNLSNSLRKRISLQHSQTFQPSFIPYRIIPSTILWIYFSQKPFITPFLFSSSNNKYQYMRYNLWQCIKISLRTRGHKSQQRRDTARTYPFCLHPNLATSFSLLAENWSAPACNFAINLSRRALMHRKCLVSPLFAPLVSRCKFIRLVVLQRRSIGHVFSH